MSANKSGGGIGSVNSVTPRAETGFADVFSSFDASIDASINATYDSRLDAFEGTSQPPHSGSPGGYGGSPPTKPGATTVVPNSLDHSAIETPAVHSLDTFDITGDFPLLSQLSAPSSSAPNSPTKRQSKRSNPGTRQMELQLQALSSQSGPVKSFLPSPITLNIRPQMQKKAKKKRRKGCGICLNCLMPDCGKCSMCRDKHKNGGLGIMKQACILRKCSNKSSQSNPNSTSSKVNKVKKTHFPKDRRILTAEERRNIPHIYRSDWPGEVEDIWNYEANNRTDRRWGIVLKEPNEKLMRFSR